MLCPGCGKEIQEGAKFCRFCGTKVAGDVETNTEKPLNTKPKDDRVETVVKHERDSRRDWLGLAVVLFVVAIIATAGILYRLFHTVEQAADERNADMAAAPTPTEQTVTAGQNEEHTAEQRVLTYDNGDTVYLPIQEAIAYDETENVIYYNDLLVVYLLSDITQGEAAALANSVNGTVVGDISGAINFLQIKVDTSDLAQLNNYAAALMEFEDVLYATYDMPIPLTADAMAEGDPWSGEPNTPETDRANEGTPAGNDWWAEATGAYTAWGYVDQGMAELAPVTVGVIDNGFDADHPEFAGRMTVKGTNTLDANGPEHGTHVAGIIAAANDTNGIRGIADRADLICVDWSTEAEDGGAVNIISTGEYIEVVKQMIDAGVRVINNSWGITFLSKKAVIDDTYAGGNYDPDVWHLIIDPLLLWKKAAADQAGSYEAYVNYIGKCSQRTAVECVLLNVELLLSQGESNRGDHIIVQSAGNGVDGAGRGINACYNGFFCGVSKDLYDMLPTEALSKAGITFEVVKDHILIVGAVENKRDSAGNYLMAGYSNFGETVDICAPGGKYEEEDISSQIFSTVLDNQYGYAFGTSMATPIVSGAAALLWSIDPDLSAKEVKDHLLNNAKVKAIGVGDDEGTEYPMLNVGAAVEALLKERDIAVKLAGDKVLTGVSMYGENNELTETVRFEYDENGQLARSIHDAYWDGELADSGWIFTYTYDDAGRLISRNYNVPSWGEIDDVARSYDEKGRLVSDYMYSEGEIFLLKDYTYDEAGKLIRENITYRSPFMIDREEHEYSYTYHTDDQGNQIGVRHDETDPGVEDKEYIYDAEGRIKQGYEEDLNGCKIDYTHTYIDDPYFLIEDSFETVIPWLGQSVTQNIRTAYILDSAGQELESFILGPPDTAQMRYNEDGYLVSVDNPESVYSTRYEFIYGAPGEAQETAVADAAQQDGQELPPLTYQERNEHYEYVTSDGLLTGTSDLAYPYFTDGSPMGEMLNESIEAILEQRRDTQLDPESESYFAEMMAQGTPPGTDDVEITVGYNADGLLSLLYRYTFYGPGGAHSYTSLEGQIYDTLTCAQLSAQALAGSRYAEMCAYLAQAASMEGISNGTPDRADTCVLREGGVDFYFNMGMAVPQVVVTVPFTAAYFDRAPAGGEAPGVENESPSQTKDGRVTLTVTGNAVNVRSGPGTNYASLGTVNKGDKLFSTDKSDNWYLVEYGGGTGYIIEDYVTVGTGGIYTETDSGTLSVNGIDVNIRSGPGTEYQLIGKVSRGTTLTITGKSDNWYQVSYNGGAGYIIEDYVTRN